MKAAEGMSAEDRAVMIEGMVSRLAAKLEIDPENPEGWVRLLRARRVMNATQAAEKDIETLREIYKNRPETLSQILGESGWSDNK